MKLGLYIMKKILYSFALLAAGLWLSSCTEVDNLGANGDTVPVVTIYSYEIPEGMDEDNTANLRYVPNLVCDHFFILIEKKVNKDAFIAANGIDAYVARVVAEGTRYDGVTELIKDAVGGTFAVTGVGVSGNMIGKPTEFIFNGVEWGLVGAALYSTPAASHALFSTPAVNNQPGNWYKSVNLDEVRYKLEVTMPDSWNNYVQVIKLNWDDEGELTFYNGRSGLLPTGWFLPTGFTIDVHGRVWVEVDRDPGYSGYNSGSNIVVMDGRYAVAAGGLGGWNSFLIFPPPLPW